MLLCHGVFKAGDAHVAAMLAPAWPSERLLVVLAGDLAALASELPPTVAPETLMATTESVAALAVEHNRVLTEFARTADILPLRLDSFHSDEPALSAMLWRETPRLTAALDRIEDSVEFGLKVEADNRSPQAASAAPITSGRDYLANRLKARDRAALQRVETERAIEGVLAALAAVSRRFVMLPVPAANRGKLLLNAAFLVPRSRRAEFAAIIESSGGEVGNSAFRLLASGPWPPYHFGESPEDSDVRPD